MEGYKAYFKGKKITIMGLGLLGRGVGDAKFLAACGAELIVTDLKSKDELAASLEELKKFKNITYVLGEHRLKDFANRDMIIKAAGVPLDSIYINAARKNNIPVEMSTALFARLAEDVTIVGVTGTRGKTTTSHLLYHILKHAGKSVWLGGNVKGMSTLALLPKVKKGDIVVLELDSWQLQGFGEAKISPKIAIFTNFMADHLNYYKSSLAKYFKDKSYIFSNQKSGDTLLVNEDVARRITKSAYADMGEGTMIVVKPPKRMQWKTSLPGEHNAQNIAFAVEAAKKLKIKGDVIRRAVASFKGVPGRLEFLKKVGGVKIYNDTTSTTPDAVLAGLRALAVKKNVVLIMGGSDKNLNQKELLKEMPKYTKAVILIPGTGTQKIEGELFNRRKIRVVRVESLMYALAFATGVAKDGDIVLFSPGFASFGMFKNEFDRGEQFVKLVKEL